MTCAHLPLLVPGVLVLVPVHAGHHATDSHPNMSSTGAGKGNGRRCADIFDGYEVLFSNVPQYTVVVVECSKTHIYLTRFARGSLKKGLSSCNETEMKDKETVCATKCRPPRDGTRNVQYYQEGTGTHLIKTNWLRKDHNDASRAIRRYEQ